MFSDSLDELLHEMRELALMYDRRSEFCAEHRDERMGGESHAYKASATMLRAALSKFLTPEARRKD